MEKLRQKIISKIQSQISEIVSDSIDELLAEGVTETELAESFCKQIDIKKKKVVSEKKPKLDGYGKLPQDEIEMIDWMRKLIKKRNETKLAGEKDEDKIFNVVTQRFMKKSACISRKDCHLSEVNFEGEKVGFTDGGAKPSLSDSPQFVIFYALFENIKNPDEEDDEESLILQKLEERPHTLAELKKVINPQKFQTIIDRLKEEDKIETDGKFVKLVELKDTTTDEED
jgi:hypothetical protein